MTHQRGSQDKAESREEPEPGGPTEKEAKSGSQPLVIDKTKEIQVIIYLVYIAVQKCGGPMHRPAHRPSD